MGNLNTFVVVAAADNISKMTPSQLKLLAELIVDSENANRLTDYLAFAIQDKLISEIEVQDPVC
jgi:hypothetical protein